jgi:hypothetical protein
MSPTIGGAATVTPTGSIVRTATNTPPPATSATPTATGPTATPTPSPTRTLAGTPQACAGDCNGDDKVTVNELVTLVNIALDNGSVAACPSGDVNHDNAIMINELLTAVNNALNGCS